MKLFRLTCVASAAAVLAACGGSDGPDRGELLDPATIVATLTAAQINAATAQSGLQAVSGPAKCDVKVVALNYATIGAKGEDGANASGVMLVPAGSDPACSGAAPLVAYARGTQVLKPRTLANPNDSETFSLIAFFASQGYAVVATDYLGYAKSTYTYHPYLHADSEASAVIDSVRAAANAASAVGAKLSGKVMFTGYSQGGHSSMAAQRAAEDKDKIKDFSVVAGAHLAGPYNLAGALSSPVVTAAAQMFLPFIVTSWQHVYGNIYSDVTKAFKAPYDSYIETLMPNPAWMQREMQSQQFLAQSFRTAQQAEQYRAQQALETQRYLQDVGAQIVEHRRRVNAEIRNDQYLNMTNQEEYKNPYTGDIDLGSNQYRCRWVNNNNQEFYTDDPSQDPNHVDGLNQSEWQRSQVRPRYPDQG